MEFRGATESEQPDGSSVVTADFETVGLKAATSVSGDYDAIDLTLTGGIGGQPQEIPIGRLTVYRPTGLITWTPLFPTE